MESCPYCEMLLETPYCCVSCGQVFSPERYPTPFEAFGLPLNYGVDTEELERRLLRYSRLVHPDFFATASEEMRRTAEENSAALNGAFKILTDDARRAEWVIEALGGPSGGDEKQLPREFLMEVLEWNEALDEADGAPEGSPAHAELERLAKVLHHEHETRLAALGARLTPLPAEGADELLVVRQELNAVRYLSRTLFRIRNLRFGTPKV